MTIAILKFPRILINPGIDYLMGHWTKANVESFVSRRVAAWGPQSLQININWDWGHPKLLETDAAILVLREDNLNMASGNNVSNINPAGMQLDNMKYKLGPPLGIPLAVLDGMQNTYSKYTRDLVTHGLIMYADRAHVHQESDLHRQLLKSICAYYVNTSATDYEVMKLPNTQYPSADFLIGHTPSKCN